jgi:hypothetical protein
LPAAVVACLLAAACDRGSPIPEDELRIAASVGASEAPAGRSFEVTVVRSFDRELEPEPWTDRMLAPLAVRSVRTTRREDAHRIEETRSFRAYGFEPGAIAVPPLSFRATPKSGGPARVATCEGFTVAVKATLDRDNPGPPELPGDPPPEKRPIAPWIAVAAAIAAALAGLVIATRRRTPALAPDARRASADEALLARIEQLRGREAPDRDAIRAWHLEASDAVRGWVAGRHDIHAFEMTTEEILGAAALPGEARTRLAEVLAPCDLVKFADAPSTANARARLLDAAGALARGP